MSDLRAKIFAAKDIGVQVIAVPEWDVQIEVRGMTGQERSEFMRAAIDHKTGQPRLDRVYSQVVITCCYDPATGERLFSDADRDLLDTKAASATALLAQVAMELSGIDEDAVNRGKDGSKTTRSAASGSASPGTST